MRTENKKGRLVVVSNRLPFTASVHDETLRFTESAGGLVSGLSAYLQGLKNTRPDDPRSYLWVGWPGSTIPPEAQAALTDEARRRFNAVPVLLDRKEMENFYFGFCNKTIWPLFHYFPTYALYQEEFWQQYKKVNAAFCDALIGTAPGRRCRVGPRLPPDAAPRAREGAGAQCSRRFFPPYPLPFI